jgi:type II secretory pathway component PulF
MIATSFEYLAMDRRGERVRGVAKGQTEADVVRQVTSSGLTPVRVRKARVKRVGSKRIRPKDISQFVYQLSVLINARIPIGEGLRSIAEQEGPGKFRDMLLQMAIKIESGDRIASAMAEHEKVLGKVMIETISAAEQSGNLVKVLEYLSEMTERQMEMRQQVRGALMYPICVIGVLAIAVVFLVGFVVPKFARMFLSRGIELPIFTRILMWIGESVQGFWWLYLVLLIGGAFGIRRAWRRPGSRRKIERGFDRVPVLNRLLKGMAVARFARVFGLSLGAGITLLDALRMSSRAAGNLGLGGDIDRTIDQVRAGGKMSGALAMSQYLPPFAKRMLTSGEESAELPRMCGVIARHYERETSALAKNFATVIEPVMIVLIATVVLVIALAIFLPMWNMVQVMQH